MRIVCISDTHGRHDRIQIPDGDLLIHAGDLTRRGKMGDLEGFARWVRALPHAQKVVIAGNHDRCCETHPVEARAILEDHSVRYLCDEGFWWNGRYIWGSPWTPEFGRWAFMQPRGTLGDHWQRIPARVDIVVTHGPAMGLRDVNIAGWHVGCGNLADRLCALQPPLHVCGHIHEAYGIQQLQDRMVVNAAVCNLGLQPVQPIQVIEWDVNGMRKVPADAQAEKDEVG